MGAIDDLNRALETLKAQSSSGRRFFRAREGKPLAGGPVPDISLKRKTPLIYRRGNRHGSPREGDGKGEIIFFGILSSVLLIVTGAAASLEYVSLIGALGAILFMIPLFLKTYKHFSPDRGADISDDDLRRIFEMEKKIDEINLKTEFGERYNPERIKNLEEKVDELRYIVKSLIRAIEGKEEE